MAKYILPLLLFISSSLFSQSSQWLHYDTTNTSMPTNRLGPIGIDQNNNVWVGTDLHNGLQKFDNNSWSNIPGHPALYAATHLVIDQSGNIWIGTPAYGVFFFDGTAWQRFTDTNSPLPSNDITALYADNMNNIWIGTALGLAKLNGSTWTIFNTANSNICSNWITSLDQDASGNLWMGGYPTWSGPNLVGGGLCMLSGTTFTTYNSSNSPLLDDYVGHVRCDNNNNIWLSTVTGIFKFDNTNWIHYNAANSPLPNDTILTIELDDQNILWAGCPQGLIKFSGATATLYNILNPDTNTYVSDIEIDNFGNKWITYAKPDFFWGFYSGYGVSVFNEPNLSGPLSLKQDVSDVDVLPYPNPFTSSTTFEISDPNSLPYDLVLYDNFGRKVRRINKITTPRFELHRDDLPAGIYFYRLQSEKEAASGKLIIE